MEYAILEGNMERLEKKLLRIQNKCQKYGCEFHYQKIGETFRKMEDEFGNEFTVKFIIVDAYGTAIVNDWEFIATLNHTNNGNIIRKAPTIPEVQVPERYYNSKPVCEHCNCSRIRKDTYIVRNTKTGEFKQVGKSCLNDFTNGLSAEAITKYISGFDELICGEYPIEGEHYKEYFDTEEVLKFAVECVKKFGYIRKNGIGTSTSIMTLQAYLLSIGRLYGKEKDSVIKTLEKVNFNPETDENEKQVKDAIEWVKSQRDCSEWIHNLKVLISSKYVTEKDFGLLVSLLPAYYKNVSYQSQKAKEMESEMEASNYIGEVKERITVEVCEIKCVTSWETDYGTTHIYKIIDKVGNVLTWKSSKCILDENIKSITGTVKGHTEYRGVKQTELTRCRLNIA